MRNLLCLIFGHRWITIRIKELWGCSDALYCTRCHSVPAKPLDDWELCEGGY